MAHEAKHPDLEEGQAYAEDLADSSNRFNAGAFVMSGGDTALAEETALTEVATAEDDTSEEMIWNDEAWVEAEAEEPARGGQIIFLMAGFVITLWSAFFIWSNRKMGVGIAAGDMSALGGLLTQWAVPVLLVLLVVHMLRSSSLAERRRFATVSASMRSESEALEARIKTINNEISLAREFLAEQARELESLGRISTENLNDNARSLRSLLEDGNHQARAINEVCEAASSNMDALRSHLPVISSATKDVVNLIGRAGEDISTHGDKCLVLHSQLQDASEQAELRFSQLDRHSEESRTQLQQMVSEMTGQLQQATQLFEQTTQGGGQLLAETINRLREELGAVSASIEQQSLSNRESVDAMIGEIGATLDKLAQTTRHTQSRITTMALRVNEQITGAEKRLDRLDSKGGESTARIAFAISAMDENLAKMGDRLEQETGRSLGLQEKVNALLHKLERLSGMVREDLITALDGLDERGSTSLQGLQGLSQEVDQITGKGDAFAQMLEQMAARVRSQHAELERIGASGEQSVLELGTTIGSILTKLREIRKESDSLSEQADRELGQSLKLCREQASQTANEIRAMFDDISRRATEGFIEQNEEQFSTRLQASIEETLRRVDALVAESMGAVENATQHISSQLDEADRTAMQLERRISDARKEAELNTDDDFARRVAMLNEALNSAAIDISQALEREVPDTGWAAYLRGDRGMFSRRAVRLLDSGQVRDITALYEDDSEFYEQVNRFIHDFESMLRNIMATRDGSVMSVTLLSSDIGKLYVALAQAIERFRS